MHRYNRPMNTDLIRLWQLKQALDNLSGQEGRGFDIGVYLALKENIQDEMEAIRNDLDATAKALLARNGTLDPS
jgi:peptide subunit release factor 1 (eRF1)